MSSHRATEPIAGVRLRTRHTLSEDESDVLLSDEGTLKLIGPLQDAAGPVGRWQEQAEAGT